MSEHPVPAGWLADHTSEPSPAGDDTPTAADRPSDVPPAGGLAPGVLPGPAAELASALVVAVLADDVDLADDSLEMTLHQQLGVPVCAAVAATYRDLLTRVRLDAPGSPTALVDQVVDQVDALLPAQVSVTPRRLAALLSVAHTPAGAAGEVERDLYILALGCRTLARHLDEVALTAFLDGLDHTTAAGAAERDGR